MNPLARTETTKGAQSSVDDTYIDNYKSLAAAVVLCAIKDYAKIRRVYNMNVKSLRPEDGTAESKKARGRALDAYNKAFAKNTKGLIRFFESAWCESLIWFASSGSLVMDSKDIVDAVNKYIDNGGTIKETDPAGEVEKKKKRNKRLKDLYPDNPFAEIAEENEIGYDSLMELSM